MATTLIEPKKRGVKPGTLNWQMEEFCNNLLTDPKHDGQAAAEKAGYANPGQAAAKLLKNPQVRARLGKEKHLRQERMRKTADEVLEYLEIAAFFNPLKYFSPGGRGGGWLIKEKDLKELPDEIGQLITDVEIQEIETAKGSMRLCKVRFVNKNLMIELLAKHHGLFEKDNEQQKGKYVVDLSQLYKRDVIPDTVEALIANPEPPRKIEAKIEEPLPKPAYTVDELTEME